MTIPLSFGVGLFLYSLLDDRSKKFYSLQLLSILIMELFIWLFISTTRVEIYSVVTGLLFLLAAFPIRFIFKKNPVEKNHEENLLNDGVVAVGIIDFVWITIMGISLSVLLYVKRAFPFTLNLVAHKTNGYYDRILESVYFILQNLINIIINLGIALTVCMAILWAGEIWRLKGKENNKQYKNTTRAAVKMMLAFFIIVLNIFIWYGLPLYNKINELIELAM